MNIKKLWYALRIILPASLGLVFIIGIWVYFQLRASLPLLSGDQVLSGLKAPVRIERDALGIPSITAENRLDIARAIGFLHGQERFFQMDLLRRSAAGELAELFGAEAVEKDKQRRIHRFRARAESIADLLPGRERQLLQAYSAGVNTGLNVLSAPPFEYLLLRTKPSPWRIADSVLVVYAMYLDLQDEAGRLDSIHGVMHDLLPKSLYDFFAPRGTQWDAPLRGEPFSQAPMPGQDIFDFRKLAMDPGFRLDEMPLTNMPLTEHDRSVSVIGSNNWAVAGSQSAHGGALLANDMHLALRVPNIWYRASFTYPNEHKGQRQRWVSGVSLPGMPAIVAGSNGEIAWGFTNSNIDTVDLVVLETVNDTQYATPDGPQAFQYYREFIKVKGAETQPLRIVETRWGPVVDNDYRKRPRALRWVAHDTAAVNLELLRLEQAGTVREAIEVANRAGVPQQNFVATDMHGNIGWTISGPIPRRIGFEGRLPRIWSDRHTGWQAYLSAEEYPRLINPSSARIWTANARVADGPDLAKLGFGRYALGARAKQIRDRLLALEYASEADMLALQLDNRALFLARWYQLLLEVLTPEAQAADPRRAELRRILTDWQERADADSAAYRMVRAFRTFLIQLSTEPLNLFCSQADQRFDYSYLPQSEGPLWALVTERPEHLVNPRFENWQAQLLAAVDGVLDRFTKAGSTLAQHTWGEYNTSRIQHPFARFIPLIGHWLNMPAYALPGDSHMPRVQTPGSGASQRMVVSPGREKEGFFHMPGGQSGHPLSPYYGAGHEAWVKGEATPFLPGPTAYVLSLIPD